MKTSTKVVTAIGLFLLAYTAVCLWLFRITGSEPSTLTTCVFAAATGEAGILGWIKTTKERIREREWMKEDEERRKNMNE